MKLLLLIGLTLIIPNLASAQKSNDSCFEYIYEIDSTTNRKLYLTAEIMPSFIDTSLTFNNFFSYNISYPPTECIQTRIVISFVVESDGEISNKKIINKLNCDNSKEVMLVLDNLPRMKPGLIQGKAVPVKLTYPIMIELR
jgi:protein TonB